MEIDSKGIVLVLPSPSTAVFGNNVQRGKGAGPDFGRTKFLVGSRSRDEQVTPNLTKTRGWESGLLAGYDLGQSKLFSLSPNSLIEQTT